MRRWSRAELAFGGLLLAIAAVVALEKLHRHGELISRVLGGLTLVAALVLVVEPAVLPAMS